MEEKTYNLIENYLEGNLSQEELSAVKTRLQSDPEFAQKVTLFEEVEDTLGDTTRQAIRGQLQTLGETYFTNSATKKKIKALPFYQRPWAMAASFLLIFSIGFLFWQNQPTTNLSNEQLFAQNYRAPNMDVMMRNSSAENPLQDAIQLYQKGQFEKALAGLEILQQTDPKNQKITYLIAHTYLNQTPPKLLEAGNSFKALIEHEQNVYIHKAQWYLGLIYLKQGNMEGAKTLLQAVVDSKDSNGENAEKILADL